MAGNLKLEMGGVESACGGPRHCELIPSVATFIVIQLYYSMAKTNKLRKIIRPSYGTEIARTADVHLSFAKRRSHESRCFQRYR